MGVQGSILRQNRVAHNYANLNKKGFSTVKVRRVKKAVVNKVVSVPSTPVSEAAKLKAADEGVNNTSALDHGKLIAKLKALEKCNDTLSVSVNARKKADKIKKSKPRSPTNINRNLSELFADMASGDPTKMSMEEKKRVLREDITRMQAKLADHEDQELQDLLK